MATGGETYKPYTVNTLQEVMEKRKAKAERYAKASVKQRVNWRKFRINGAAGFTQGALRSAVNRLEALKAELPKDEGIVGSHVSAMHSVLATEITILRDISVMINHYRLQVMDLAELAERKAHGIENPPGDATNGTVNSSSD
jgi:hypothetical protein